MAAEESKITIEKEPVYVDPSMIWRKGMGVIPTTAVPTITPLVPTGIKSLVIDIETTGANPWDSRLICIGYKDPSLPTEKPVVIFDESEEKVLLDFLTFFTKGGYSRIIAYNTAFDYRYLFAKCLYYRISCREFCDAKLVDVMQILAQVKEAFVYGYNKSGRLEDWMIFLFNIEKLISFEELLEAWDEKDYAKIIEYNVMDVELTFIIWSLIELVRGQNFTGSSFAAPPASIPTSSALSGTIQSPAEQSGETQTWNARCPNCYSVYVLPISQREYVCPIDGTIIKQGG